MSIRFEVISNELDLPASGTLDVELPDLEKCDLHRVVLDGSTNYDIEGTPKLRDGGAPTSDALIEAGVSDAVKTFAGVGFTKLVFTNNTAVAAKIITYSYSGL